MGRIPGNKPPSQAIQMIRTKHREIMRLQIAGLSNKQICQRLKYSEAYLSILTNSPLYKRELSRMQKDVDTEFVKSAGSFEQRIEKLKPKALDVLEELLSQQKVNGQDVPLRLKRDSARDILDIAGAGKKSYADGMTDFAKFITDAFNAAAKIQKSENPNPEPAESSESSEPMSTQVIDITAINATNTSDVEISVNTNNTKLESPIPSSLLPLPLAMPTTKEDDIRVVNE